MKRILFIVALLPFLVKAQSINNQKVRWMQPIYMGSNTAATVNSSSDTGAFFFDRSDSVLYFKYKGAARAIGYAGSIPNVGQQITDSLKALVRLRASGSGGIQLQNSVGTNVADFGIANTTNGSIAGGWNVGGNLAVTGTSGFTGKATFSDSIVGNIIRSKNTSGVSIQNNSGTTIASFGSSGGSTTTLAELSVTSGISAQTGTFSNILTVSGASNYLSLNNIGYVRSDATGNTLDLQVGTGGLRIMNNGYGSSLFNITNTGASTFSGALTATAQGNNIAVGVDSSVTSTSYTLVLGDAGYLKRCSNASAITITVPTNASVAFPIGTTIYFSQQGAGKVSVSPATSDVTIQSEGSLLGTAGQHAVIGLIKVNTNRWLLVGNRG